jgi:hypothetical protein
MPTHQYYGAMRFGCCRSHLDLFAVKHARNGWPLKHPVFERGVVPELAHGKIAAHAPSIENEAVGIEHRITVGKPLAVR